MTGPRRTSSCRSTRFRKRATDRRSAARLWALGRDLARSEAADQEAQEGGLVEVHVLVLEAEVECLEVEVGSIELPENMYNGMYQQ
jgi:hypothetical protein